MGMSHRLLINVPGGVTPAERSERFERPLRDALRRAGRVGNVAGAGTLLKVRDGAEIAGCDIEVTTADLDRALRAVRDVLAQAGAPDGTTVRLAESQALVLTVGPGGVVQAPPPGRGEQQRDAWPWQAGEVLQYRLRPGRYVLLHALSTAEWPAVRVLDWVGDAPPPGAAVRRLAAAPGGRGGIRDVFLFAGPTAHDLDPSRLTRTGVTVAPESVMGRRPRFRGFESWSAFDRFLAEVFG
jgi:hypothetical protein